MKSLEQWKKDHEIPYDAELKVTVVSWDLGNWRFLRSPELRLRVKWEEARFNLYKWSQFDHDTWAAWMKNGCRPPYYMHSPMRRREEKQRMMDQLEVYAAAMGIEMVKPLQRRSEHIGPLGFDMSAPDGGTFHYELVRDEWDYPEWKRELYGNHPEPPRCMNVAVNGDTHCENVATLRVIDRGEPTESVCCVPCSRAYPNFTYRQLRKEETHEEQGTTVDGGNPGHGEPRPD